MKTNTVQDTLRIPLSARALMGEKYPQLGNDPLPRRVLDALSKDAGKDMMVEGEESTMLAMVYRQRYLRGKVLDYLQRHPHATIINLGAGLDNVYSFSEDGEGPLVVSIDLPDVIELRRRYLPAESPRDITIAADLAEDEWYQVVKNLPDYDPNNGVILVASGVLMYLQPDQHSHLIYKIAQEFSGCELCFDIVSARVAKMSNSIIKESGNNVMLSTTMDDPLTEIPEISHGRFEVLEWVPLIDKSTLPLEGCSWKVRFPVWMMSRLRGSSYVHLRERSAEHTD